MSVSRKTLALFKISVAMVSCGVCEEALMVKQCMPWRILTTNHQKQLQSCRKLWWSGTFFCYRKRCQGGNLCWFWKLSAQSSENMLRIRAPYARKTFPCYQNSMLFVWQDTNVFLNVPIWKTLSKSITDSTYPIFW